MTSSGNTFTNISRVADVAVESILWSSSSTQIRLCVRSGLFSSSSTSKPLYVSLSLLLSLFFDSPVVPWRPDDDDDDDDAL